MKKAVVRAAAIFAVVATAVWLGRRAAPRPSEWEAAGKAAVTPPPAVAKSLPPASSPRPDASKPDAAMRAARVRAILRDYEEISAKMSADYGAAGQAFPGGLGAFLRQLALVEREKRKDLATVMTPRELEDYEIGETAAGQKMRAILDGTAATDEQRRAVFRAEQDFDDKFGFTFDLSPPALAAREAARQAAEQQVRGALGDELFVTWLQHDDPTYAHFADFAQQQNLPAGAALALLNVRNGFTLSVLDIAAAPPAAAGPRRAALLEWGREGVAAVAPSLPGDVVAREVASWLQQSPAASPAPKR